MREKEKKTAHTQKKWNKIRKKTHTTNTPNETSNKQTNKKGIIHMVEKMRALLIINECEIGF